MKTDIYTPIRLRHKLAAALNRLVALGLSFAFVTSCATDELVSTTTSTDREQQITISASLNNYNNLAPGTRIGHTPDAEIKGLKTTWTKGDALYILPVGFGGSGTGEPQIFTLDEKCDGQSVGDFIGTKLTPKDYYRVYYPATITTPSEFMRFSYIGQVQKGNNNLNHLSAKHSLATSLIDYTMIEFQKQSACMKFVLTPGVAIIPKKITLAAANGYNKCFCDINDSEEEGNTNGSTSILSIDLDDIILSNPTDQIIAYMMMSNKTVILPPEGIIVTVIDADGDAYAQLIDTSPVNGESLTLKGGLMHTITASQMKKVVFPSMNFTIRVAAGETFILPFNSRNSTPADLIVDWGDGSPAENSPKDTDYNNFNRMHTYENAGDYIITITSKQTDVTKQQIPIFSFNTDFNEKNRNMLISMNTPILNTNYPYRYGDFRGCTSLTSICAGLYDNIPQAIDFTECFSGCTALTAIPEGLFEKHTEAVSFAKCFNGCTNLKLNANIFGNSKDRFKDKAIDFSNCFNGVGSALTDIATSTAPELWTYERGSGEWTTTDCFTNSKFNNSDAIPVDWGGTKQ